MHPDRCFECDNSVDAGWCPINPMVYAKKIFCPKGELCSVERKESPSKNMNSFIDFIDNKILICLFLAAVGFTKSNGVKTSGTKTTRFTSAPAK